MGWLPKKERECIDCGKKGVIERRRCKECALKYNRDRARKRHNEKGRYYKNGVCSICGEHMKVWRKDQNAHKDCFNKTRLNAGSHYTKQSRAKDGKTKGRFIVNSLGISIPNNYVVHHLDMNPENNELSNLILLSRSEHAKLHRYLEHHWSLFLKENSSNSENCWNILRTHLTTAWFEKTSAKVIRISEIGQSAAEPLSSNE